MVYRRFIRATAPSPLRTLRQWQAVQALPSPGRPPRMRFCGHCGEEYEMARDQAGDLMPCPNCGRGWRDASVPGAPVRFQTYDPPDTGRRITELRAKAVHGQVSELEPVPVVARSMAVPQRRETYAFRGSWNDRLLTYQAEHGMREKPATVLRTMEGKPCERCHRMTCNCPPPAPDINAALVAQRTRDLDRQDRADQAAYPHYAALRKGQP
jgi:hypothetical protein